MERTALPFGSNPAVVICVQGRGCWDTGERVKRSTGVGVRSFGKSPNTEVLHPGVSGFSQTDSHRPRVRSWQLTTLAPQRRPRGGRGGKAHGCG